MIEFLKKLEHLHTIFIIFITYVLLKNLCAQFYYIYYICFNKKITIFINKLNPNQT